MRDFPVSCNYGMYRVILGRDRGLTHFPFRANVEISMASCFPAEFHGPDGSAGDKVRPARPRDL